jgi:hypothetical protein
VPLVDEPEVHLMNERSRLQSVLRSFAPQLAGGYTAEFPINERQQLIACANVAASPISE